jgi:hypothetical protein
MPQRNSLAPTVQQSADLADYLIYYKGKCKAKPKLYVTTTSEIWRRFSVSEIAIRIEIWPAQETIVSKQEQENKRL